MLRAGSLGRGFGAASVTDLVAEGSATLNGNVTIGDGELDTIKVIGSLVTPSLVFDEDENGGRHEVDCAGSKHRHQEGRYIGDSS